MRSPRLLPARVAMSAGALLLALSSPAADHREVVIRGVAVCLDEAGEPAAAECPDDPAGGWALRSADGALHRLASEDPRVVMLTDPRIRSKELQITAWKDDEGKLAIVRLRTVIDGRLHDPHYYCAVCSIRSNAPGPCWCCRAPFEFREPELPGAAAVPAPNPGG